MRALGGEPVTLDPQQAADNASLGLVADLYEGLVTEEADGRLVPGAAAYWTVDATGKHWLFHLRPGLRWADGRPLVASDFVAGLDEARRPGTSAPFGALLQVITRAAAPQPDEVELELAQPTAELPALLALPVAAPRPSAPAVATIGNGPFRLVSRRPGQDVTLERNPHFRALQDVAVERVRYLTLEDLGTELNLYRAGQLDVTSEVPNSQVPWIREHLADEFHVAPFMATYAYALNLKRLHSRAARTALALAVDRERITQRVTGAGETPAYGWVPPVPGYTPARLDGSTLAAADRSTRAVAAWAKARAEGNAPARLVLCTDASANHHRTAVALADQWHSTLGVDVELREMEWKSYLAVRDDPGDCDLLRFGWSADYVDPAAFLDLFASGSAENVFGYRNATLDALLAQARATSDPAVRNQLLHSAEQQLLDDLPIVPIFHRVTKRLVKPYVHGVVDNPLGHLASRYLRLDNKPAS